MGCCLTTNRQTQNPTPSQKQTQQQLQSELDQPQSLSNSRSTLSLDVETVKEVLSETPLQDHHHRHHHHHHQQQQQQNPTKPNTKKVDNEPSIPFLDEKFEILKCVSDERVEIETPTPPLLDEKVESCKCKKNNERELIKQKQREEIAVEQELSVSETYSFSLSESTTCVSTTTTINNDDDEVKQPPKKLPPRNRVRVVGNSPSRRSGQSTAMHNGGGRGGSERLVARREPGSFGKKKMRSDPNRRDPCQNKMARSPGTNRSVTGRGQSPDRVRKDPQESDRLAMNNSDDKTTGHVNETLENPLVSLECFIFL